MALLKFLTRRLPRGRIALNRRARCAVQEISDALHGGDDHREARSAGAHMLGCHAHSIRIAHGHSAEFVDVDRFRRPHAPSIQSRAMWTAIHQFKDIKYERSKDGIAKITINRPEMRNAFRPLTVSELKEAFEMAPE